MENSRQRDYEKQLSSFGSEGGAVSRLHYPIVVYYSEEDECFVAKSPSWPSLGAHGDVESEAVENMTQVIALAIKSCEELEKPIPPRDPVIGALIRYREFLDYEKMAIEIRIGRDVLNRALERRGTLDTESTSRIRQFMESRGLPVLG